MFKNEFQGGPYFEVFSAQGKDPTSLWKLQGGSGIRKVYDRDVKSYVYSLEGTAATTKMQIPKDPKLNLTLVQRFLVLQLFVAKGQELSLEIGVTDVGNSKRRLNFSTAVRELSITPLHAKIPFTILQRAVWLNCCFDMVAIVGDLWRGQTYHSIDSITVSANCRLRRVFTMKLPPHDTTDDSEVYKLQQYEGEHDMIPRSCQIAPDVPHKTQIINVAKVREAEARAKGERSHSLEIDLNASGRKMTSSDGYHIAFGTKVAAPPLTASHRKGSLKDTPGTSSARASNSVEFSASLMAPAAAAQDLSASGTKQMLLQNGRRLRLYSETSEDGHDAYSTDITNNNNHLLVLGAPVHDLPGDKAAVLPHPPPPRENANERRSRRSVRVRSGGKYRTPVTGEPPMQSARGNHVSVSAPAHLRTRGGDEVDYEAEARGAGDATVAVRDRASLKLAESHGEDPARRDADLKQPGPRRKLAAVSPRDLDSIARPMDSRTAPLAPIASAKQARTRIPTAAEGLSSGDSVRANDSISDVIEILHSRHPGQRAVAVNGTNDPSLFTDDGQPLYQEDEVADEGLFEFSSPPKAAAAHARAAVSDGMPRRKDAHHFGMGARESAVPAAAAAAPPVQSAEPSSRLAGASGAAAAVPAGARRYGHAAHHRSAIGKLDLTSAAAADQRAGGAAEPPPTPGALSPPSAANGLPVTAGALLSNGRGGSGQPAPAVPPLMTPRPPESPRAGSSSRPGSGRLRSVNSSAKTSPSTSGTAAALHDAMQSAALHAAPPRADGDGEQRVDSGRAGRRLQQQQLLHPQSSAADVPTPAEQRHAARSAAASTRDGPATQLPVPPPVTSASQPKVAASRLHSLPLPIPSSSSAVARGSADGSDEGSSPRAGQRSSTPSSAEAVAVPRSALSRVELRTRDSDRMSAASVSSQASARLTRKSLKEIPKDDVRLSKTRLSMAKEYDSQKYQLNKDDTFDENDMLEWMKRDQEGMTGSATAAAAATHLSPIDAAKKHRYERDVDSYEAVEDDSDSLSDDSLAHHKSNQATTAGGLNNTNSTAPDYLNESNPREWSECSIFSPPIEPRADEAALDALHNSDVYHISKRGPLKTAQHNRHANESHSMNVESDSEDELDLLYDPILNCYFDPVTCKYYELI